MDIDLDLLRCFVIVADARNFTLAGDRLGRSQSAVSVRVKKLEDVIGGQLFARNSHDVQLTERGRMLLPKAKSMLEAGEQLLADMRSPAISGVLRIGFVEYLGPHKIPDILAAIQRRLPDADLRFRVGLSQPLQDAVHHGTLDVALALHDPTSEGSTILGADPLVWVESDHGLSARTDPSVKLCLMQDPCYYRHAAQDALASAGIAFDEVLTANSVQSIRSAVASGLGCSVLGASCLGDGLQVSRHMQSLIELPVASLSLHGHDRRKDALLDVMRAVLADTLAGL